jgi:hypothetical protein
VAILALDFVLAMTLNRLHQELWPVSASHLL